MIGFAIGAVLLVIVILLEDGLDLGALEIKKEIIAAEREKIFYK